MYLVCKICCYFISIINHLNCCGISRSNNLTFHVATLATLNEPNEIIWIYIFRWALTTVGIQSETRKSNKHRNILRSYSCRKTVEKILLTSRQQQKQKCVVVNFYIYWTSVISTEITDFYLKILYVYLNLIQWDKCELNPYNNRYGE